MFGYNALLAEQLQTPSETQVASILWSLGFARLQQMAHKFNCHKMKKKLKPRPKTNGKTYINAALDALPNE